MPSIMLWQQFLEPLVPSAVAAEAAAAAEKAAERQAEGIRSWSARLNLVIEVLDHLLYIYNSKRNT